MILPTKHISARDSLLGIGALLLRELGAPRTLSDLWDRTRVLPEIETFERLILGLNLLYAMGLINLENDLIKGTNR